MSELQLLDAVARWPDSVSIPVGPVENIEILVETSSSVPFPVAPGQFRFVHDCRMIDEHHRVRCAPALHSAHRVEWRQDGLWVSPSILCPDCGTHGFISGSRWVPA